MGARASLCFKKQEAINVIDQPSFADEPVRPLECASHEAGEVVIESSAAGEVDESTAAACPTADVADETLATSEVDAVTMQGTQSSAKMYSEALARCTELRRTREQLLQARMKVKATIMQFAPAFHDSDEDTSSDSGGDKDEEDNEEVAALDDLGASQTTGEMLCYEDLLAEEEELQDEVESLREMLHEAAAMIASVVEKSTELSEHLEEVTEKATSETSSYDAAPFQVSVVPVPSKHIEDFKIPTLNFLTTAGVAGEDLKLPNMRFLTVPGKGGSDASSSTATPRSENESRMASARSEPCWIEA